MTFYLRMFELRSFTLKNKKHYNKLQVLHEKCPVLFCLSLHFLRAEKCGRHSELFTKVQVVYIINASNRNIVVCVLVLSAVIKIHNSIHPAWDWVVMEIMLLDETWPDKTKLNYAQQNTNKYMREYFVMWVTKPVKQIPNRF